MRSIDGKPLGPCAELAFCLLVVLCVLAGCTRVDPAAQPAPGAAPARPANDPSAATAPARAPFDFDAYRRISSSFIKVFVAGGEHPMRTATRSVLDRLDLPPGEHVPFSQKLNTRAGGDGQANVLVTYTDLKDDAVAARRYLLRMYAYQRNWVLSEIGVQYRCRRGPQERRRRWSKARCP